MLPPTSLRRAERVTVPRIAGTRRVPNGQEVISIAGGLELNTPVWANEMHEYPYLQWQAEVHRAKLKAAYPHAADKIESAPSQGAEDVYARVSRLSVEQGLPSIHPGDALMNLITFDRTWLRPWAFYSIEDANTRNELLALFPDGCYVAFAGEVYCESRSESMDDHWRVLHALPGDGQNRPSVGDSLVQVQERYNVLSNMQAETYEYGIPPIYADPQVLDFDALANQIAEPAAHFPARARPGQPLSAGFFQPAPAQVPPDMQRHQQDLIGPVAQFLTGLFPAIFGGNMEDVKTASGYALARDQAMGRLGLVWRRTKQFYADVMLLAVDCFRKNRPEDVEIPLLGADGIFDSRAIRLADLKGNICVHPEADETFPRLKSQQRGVLQQLFTINDPVLQRALVEPANLGYIKNVLGLTELVIPGEDSRNKQLREIQQLLASAPIVVEVPGSIASGEPPRTVISSEARTAGPPRVLGAENLSSSPVGAQHAAPQLGEVSAPGPVTAPEPQSPVTNHQSPTLVLPSVPVDQLLDDHATEFEECKRWANSDAGQAARMTNPAGFANVRAHAEAHLRAMSLVAQPFLPAPAGTRDAPRSQPRQAPSALHTTSTAVARRTPGDFPSRAEEDDRPGDHWVTIDGQHVLIHEPQGQQDQPIPQSLATQIPCHVKAAIADSIKASNSPTSDDKKGGFHEEGGQWVIVEGKTVPLPAKPGRANLAIEGGADVSPSDAIDPGAKSGNFALGGTWHVHPQGTVTEQEGNVRTTKTFSQPPSAKDLKEAGAGINIVIGAGSKKVYFYDSSGVIGHPMKLKDFLKGC
jgi:hypothetical protein